MRGAIMAGMLAAGLALFSSAAAAAKPAECFTTDEGRFACEFVATDKGGSFEISGSGVGYSLVVERPGVALGYLLLGGRSVALPGRYLRSREEPACWVNDETQARICAW